MLQHLKRQVELFEMPCFTMFITALYAIFLIKLRWPKNRIMVCFSLSATEMNLSTNVNA